MQIANGYISSRERSLVAIETLWRVTTEIKKETRVVTLFYAILLPSEYSTVVPNNDYLKNSSGSLSDFNKKLIPKISEVQEQRPFLGEELYRLYFIFQAFAFRQAIKILSRKDKNTIYEWDKDFDGEKDISMYQTLKEIFTEDTLEPATFQRFSIVLLQKRQHFIAPVDPVLLIANAAPQS
jgi:hypothetical protein